MACRIPEHPKKVLPDGIVDAGRAQRQNLTLRRVRIVDLDVQVNLLGAPRIRELRRLMLR